tara:strand:+ start:722 stop:901 length:180 start_codon:yes stop_codon:yes gene_type:complete
VKFIREEALQRSSLLSTTAHTPRNQILSKGMKKKRKKKKEKERTTEIKIYRKDRYLIIL